MDTSSVIEGELGTDTLAETSDSNMTLGVTTLTVGAGPAERFLFLGAEGLQ